MMSFLVILKNSHDAVYRVLLLHFCLPLTKSCSGPKMVDRNSPRFTPWDKIRLKVPVDDKIGVSHTGHVIFFYTDGPPHPGIFFRAAPARLRRNRDYGSRESTRYRAFYGSQASRFVWIGVGRFHEKNVAMR